MKIIRTSNNIGVIGVKATTIDRKKQLFERTFEFLCELSVIMLERIQLDQMKDNDV